VLRRRLDELNVSPPIDGGGNGRRSGRRHRDAPVPPSGTLNGPPGGPAPPGAPGARTGPIGRMPAPAALTAVLARGGGGTGSRTLADQPGGTRTASDLDVARRSEARSTSGLPRPPTASGPPGQPSRPPDRPSRRRRGPGLVVLGLVLAGAVVAGVLLTAHHDPAPAAGTKSSRLTGRQVASATPFMLRGRPDDPQGLPFLFDHNPTTAWHTDQYRTAAFGNLYPGLGVSIQLSASGTFHHLLVNSPSTGWAAQTYVSSSPIASGQPVAAWGKPTDTKTDISGSVTFDLSGRRGQWILLWLTHLSTNPPFQVSINEITVT
jgi:hypothetical protein